MLASRLKRTLRRKTSGRKGAAPLCVRVPNTLYLNLVQVTAPRGKHAYPCLMNFIASASLHESGKFTTFDCAKETHYPVHDCTLVCEAFYRAGMLLKVYDAGDERAISVYKRTESIILHAHGAPAQRARALADKASLLDWIRTTERICVKPN
jgi:hypothetical protein